MPWQCSFKKLCFFAPIMPKIMLAQSAKAYPQLPRASYSIMIPSYHIPVTSPTDISHPGNIYLYQSSAFHVIADSRFSLLMLRIEHIYRCIKLKAIKWKTHLDAIFSLDLILTSSFTNDFYTADKHSPHPCLYAHPNPLTKLYRPIHNC